ncbi:MAG: hypothetical protein Q9181_000923 [Wetmoreana brouardii]
MHMRASPGLLHGETKATSNYAGENPGQQYFAAIRNFSMTSFSPLTGYRNRAIEAKAINVTSCESNFSLLQLQNAAQRYDASPAAILQAAWARILQVYTATKDDIVFHCTLSCDGYTGDSHLSSLIVCAPQAQAQGHEGFGHLVRNCNDSISHNSGEVKSSQNLDDPDGGQQENGTLLDLSCLLSSPPTCELSGDAGRNSVKNAAAVCLEVSQSPAGSLSLTVSGRDGLINDSVAKLLLSQYDYVLTVIPPTSESVYPPTALLSISNPTPTVSTSSSSLQSQLENTAELDPQRVALEFWTEQRPGSLRPHTVWTYSELNQRAETVCAALESRFGSLIDHVVAVCMDRCPEIYVAILGVLKAGGAWCPIDPSFPSLRRHDLIARCGAEIVIINSRSPPDGIPEQAVAVDMTGLDWSSSKRSDRIVIDQDKLAYLIWTSGTTGAPKGVPICHRAATASMEALQACIPTDVKQGTVRCLQFSQFTFDVFVQDLFYTWGVGGTLVSADRATMLGSFSELATKAEATHAHLTPAFAASVLRKTCPTLQVVTMIGEKLTQDVAHDWSEGCRLYNTYGPAEATVVSTLRHVPSGDVVQSANIGHPLPSVSAFVIQHGEVALKNGIGELALGGPQLARGYWKDRTRTRERFVWNKHLQTTLYMTGDVVRQLHDGSFEFFGRTDDLIKIQGIRIELSEIAYALRSCHPQLRQVEVLFLERPDRPSKVIVAFLAAPELKAFSVTDKTKIEVARKAREAASMILPDYMIPKVFLVIDEVPRTPSAKVDRAAMAQIYADIDLTVLERNMSLSSRDGVDANELELDEITIMDTIVELTGTLSSAMSRQSALASIGVDSITAIPLAARLNAQAIAMSVADILQCATLDDLFEYSRKESAGAAPDTSALTAFHEDCLGSVAEGLAKHVELIMPMLPLQEAMISESFRNSTSYWSHNLFELDLGTELEKLEEAWQHVTQRNDALRTVFLPVASMVKKPDIDMTFIQVILHEMRVDWKVLSATEDSIEKTIRERARQTAERSQERRFTEPPWAVTIFMLESHIAMLLSIHHAIRDEPSLDMIMADLQSVYTDDSLRLLRQRHQLRDAVSLLYPVDTDCLEAAEEYWNNRLSGFECSKPWPELKLASGERNEGTITYAWDAETPYSVLRAKAAKIGAVSLATVLRAVLGCILLEYLEADSVVFGETWSARSEASVLTDVVGPLVFVLPVPIRAQDTLQEMCERINLSRKHHVAHPSKLRRLLNRSEEEKLYPAIFNFVPEPIEEDGNSSVLRWRKMDNVVELSVEHSVAFNVTVSSNDMLKFDLTAVKQWTDREHLHIVADQINFLLLSILDNPGKQFGQLYNQMPQSQLSITSTNEFNATNVAWTQTPTAWVDYNATNHPDWPAVEVVSSLSIDQVASESWSYKRLQESYKHVAARIREFACEKRMIAVCLDRRLDLYAVVLGIMSTGNTYLPIADDLPEERKSFLLKDSDAAMLFTTKSLASGFSRSCHTLFVEDTDYSKGTSRHTQTSPVLPTDNAYLLYTSGSTGTPKGVLVNRGNLMSFVEAISHFICEHVDVGSLAGHGKWLGMASYAFDVHLLEMFFPWRHGMSIVTAPRSMLLDSLELALQKLRVTHASFVPSLVDNAGLDPANLPDLRYMSLGGEMISRKAIDTWSRSHVVLANAYGPTEVTIGCCFRKVGPTTNVRNIGRPLLYTVAHVLRPGTTEYALRGTSGELCLTGDLIATGYHRRPDAKGFVIDFHGSRMYRTGDKVRLMADGSLEFLGRDDDQTKIRGQRIELAEVSEAVRSAVVRIMGAKSIDVVSLVLQHPALRRPQLVVFVAIESNTEAVVITAFPNKSVIEEIQGHCHSTLPTFMVPDRIVRLSSLPRVATSRKTDIKYLRAIFSDLTLDDLMLLDKPMSSSEGALSETEVTIRGLVAEVLAVDEARLNAESDLFQFGLDSLNAISLTIKLSKKGVERSVTNILRHPTIKALAASPCHKQKTHDPRLITDVQQRFLADTKNGFEPSNIVAIRPCLPLQETLVASSLNQEGEVLYVNHVILEMPPNVEYQSLIQAWRLTAEDHEILRTCFHEFEDNFVQVVLQNSSLACDCMEPGLAGSTLSHLRRRENDIATEIVANIESKPPIRLTLAAAGAKGKKGFLLVSLHHALYDAESFSMILDEVYARYQKNSLPSVRTPVTALIDHIESQNEGDARKFWTTYLADYSPSTSTDPAPNSRSRSVSKELVTPLSGLEKLAMSFNGTSASLMQVLFGVAMAEMIGTDDLIFGTILSGRTVSVENAHSILAPCITTIPQRIRIARSSSIEDVIQSAQKGFIESLEYQHTALRSIHRWVVAQRPLFDTLFTYTRKDGERPWACLWREVESSMSSGFTLAMEVMADQVTNKIVCRCDGSFKGADSLLMRLDNLIQSLVNQETVTLEKHLREGSQAHLPRSFNESQWTETESAMKDVIATLVDVNPDHIARDTAFFAMGLDSIIAIRLVKQLKQHDILCSSADVMRYPCIGKLAQQVKPRSGPTSTIRDPVEDLTPRAPRKTYPCTPLQSSMLTQTLGSDTSLYVHHHAFRLSARDDKPRIKKVWEAVVAGTEILRTSFYFSEKDGTWLGAVQEQPLITWVEHGTDVSMEKAMAQVKENFVFQKEVAFDKPPWAVNIVGDIFILSLHHSLYDGESVHLLFQDFRGLLRGFPLPQRPSFSQAAELVEERSRDAETHWVRSLVGFQGNTMIAAPRKPQEKMTIFNVDVPSMLCNCRALGVTLQSMLLLTLGKTLAWLSKQRDIVFGHVVRGRTLPSLEADDVIGPLFNTVPMRVNLGRTDATNRDIVQSIQETTGRSQGYQHASLTKVQQAWRKDIGNSEAELFDTIFVFQKRATAYSEQPWPAVALDDDVTPTEYVTNFEAEQTDNEINISINSRIIEDLDAFLQAFELLLSDICQCPDNLVSKVLDDMPPPSGDTLGSIRTTTLEDNPDPYFTGDTLGIVRKLLADVSGIKNEHIGNDASIFSLGLDSISAIQVVAAARRQGLSLSVADVLQGRTVKGISQRLDQCQNWTKIAKSEPNRQTVAESNNKGAENARSSCISKSIGAEAQALIGLRDEDVEEVSSLLPGQRYHLSIWLKSGRTLGEGIWVYRSNRILDVERLLAAWRSLRHRHTILRTAFVSRGHGKAVQVVLKPVAVKSDAFQLIDNNPERETRHVVRLIACRRFDLYSSPAELTLIRDRQTEYVVLKLHHALYDAWTITKLIHELSTLYEGSTPPVLPKSSSLIQDILASPKRENCQEYWRKTLDGHQETILRSALEAPQASDRPFFFTRSIVPHLRQLEERCQRYDTSLPTVILLAFARTLTQAATVRSPVFGLYQTGRSFNIHGFNEACIPCLNVTPLMARDIAAKDTKTCVEELQSDLAARVPFEQSYLHDVLDWVGWEPKPLFNTFINILWNTEADDSPASSEMLLSQWKDGDGDDIVPYQRLPGRTAVDGMDTSFLADENLFLDVEKCVYEDMLRLVVRCDYGAMSEDKAKAFVVQVGEEIARCVGLGSMEDDGKEWTDQQR